MEIRREFPASVKGSRSLLNKFFRVLNDCEIPPERPTPIEGFLTRGFLDLSDSVDPDKPLSRPIEKTASDSSDVS